MFTEAVLGIGLLGHFSSDLDRANSGAVVRVVRHGVRSLRLRLPVSAGAPPISPQGRRQRASGARFNGHFAQLLGPPLQIFLRRHAQPMSTPVRSGRCRAGGPRAIRVHWAGGLGHRRRFLWIHADLLRKNRSGGCGAVSQNIMHLRRFRFQGRLRAQRGPAASQGTRPRLRPRSSFLGLIGVPADPIMLDMPGTISADDIVGCQSHTRVLL